MSIEQYTYWSMTLNNPDENDWVLVRNPNEKYVRQLIHTREVGEEGTEHIQAWVRLQRNQTRKFMSRLWPKGHFQPIKKDEYNENCINYAQKNDDTTGGYHVNTVNDPIPANDTLLYKVLEKSFNALIQEYPEWEARYEKYGTGITDMPEFKLSKLRTELIERNMVMEKAGLEKIFCSPAYEKMKTRFFREIIFRILTIQQDAANEGRENDETSSGQDEESTIKDTEGEDHEDSGSETDEGHSKGSGDETYEEDDSWPSRKQGGRVARRRQPAQFRHYSG